MAKSSRTSRTIRIANRSPGGLWWRVPVALGLWAILVAPLVALVMAVLLLRHYVADLPEVPDLDGWDERAPQTSVILAADGTVLAEMPFRRQDGVVGHRSHVPFARVPALVVQAFLAAEDVRFFEHHGVDTRAVVRAAWINYRAGRVVEGASTITQQVARNLLPDAIGDERTLRRKIREALMARRIETHYSKERVFEVYVNHVFLGAGAYGVAAAAHAYFAKELHELEVHEAAMIAGLAQAPGRADPWKDRDAARTRRDQVLERMARAGFIDATQAEQAMARPLGLTPPSTRYGRLAPWYTEYVRREVETAWPEAYARGGLRIETGLWPALAHEAEMLALDNARRVAEEDGRLPEVGALIWDHRTGYVEATVGGLSWSESRFDRATQACRQPGSAFKPVLYAAALKADVITPGTLLRDAPIVEYDEDLDVYWKPGTGGRAYRGAVLAQDALASSLNAPAIEVFDRVGGEHVIDLARRLGISTELADVRPLALGASCVKPIELAGAFAVFARRGLRAQPIFTVRVYRPGSREMAPDDHHRDRASPHDPTLAPARRLDRLADLAGERPERVLDEVSAFLITAMLRQVVERGTATAARALGRPVAGKTGTTNDNTDAWFVGLSSRLVVAVWIGHDDPAHTLGPRRGGAHAALPLWMRLIALAEGERPAEPLLEPVPAGVARARVDRETGLLAEPHAGGSVELYFRQGTEPTKRAGHVPGVPIDLGRVSREF